MKNKKAIFFDCDGTLLPFDRDVWPDETRKAIIDIKSRGHDLYIATGRHYYNIPEFLIDSNLFEAYICLNGQIAVKDEKTLYKIPIDKKNKEKIIKIAKFHTLPVLYVGEKDVVLTASTPATKSWEDIIRDVNFIRIGEDIPEELYQVVFFGPKYIDEPIQKELLDEYYTVRWHPDFVDVNKKGVSKALGIQYIMDVRNYDKSQIIAVGDAQNDREMISFADIGIAMSRADNTTRLLATKIVSDSDKGGIAEVNEYLKSLGI